MLTDIEADILFIFSDSHPQGPVDNKCDAIGHHKSKYECCNCAYGIYCKLSRHYLQPVLEIPPIAAAAKIPVATVPQRPPIP